MKTKMVPMQPQRPPPIFLAPIKASIALINFSIVNSYLKYKNTKKNVLTGYARADF